MPQIVASPGQFNFSIAEVIATSERVNAQYALAAGGGVFVFSGTDSVSIVDQEIILRTIADGGVFLLTGQPVTFRMVVPPSPVLLTIAIATPADGAVVRNGSVTIAANANRAGTIVISADGKVLQTCIGGTACSVAWPGKTISVGMHTITAKVTDAAGLSGTASITIRKR